MRVGEHERRPVVTTDTSAADETATTTATTTTDADTTQTGEDGLPDAVKAVLAKERKVARDAEKARKAAEARIAEFEDRDKTEAQKLEERATKAESDLAPAKAENARLRTILGKALAKEDADRLLDLADRLRGETPEELEADAERLLAWAKPTQTADIGLGPRGDAPDVGNDMNAALRRAAGRTS